MSKGLRVWLKKFNEFAEAVYEIDFEDRVVRIEHGDYFKFDEVEFYLGENKIDTIEKELKRLEAIDNAKAGEAFEWLDLLDCDLQATNDLLTRTINGKTYFEILDTIKQSLLKAQEQEKENEILKEYRKDYLNRLKNLEEYSLKQDRVLEVIKEKTAESADAINYIQISKNYPRMQDYEHYCMAVKYKVNKDEFDLLKEVFKDE